MTKGKKAEGKGDAIWRTDEDYMSRMRRTYPIKKRRYQVWRRRRQEVSLTGSPVSGSVISKNPFLKELGRIKRLL